MTVIDGTQLRQIAAELLRIGADLAEKGLLDEAIEIFEQALVLNPKDADTIYTNLGHVYQDKGLTDEAIANYEQALRLNPKLEDALERLGTAYASKGLFGKAISCYERAIILNPTDPVLLTNIGKACLDKGLAKEAIAHLRQGSSLNPNSDNIHNTLGTAYSKEGLANEAIAEFKRATQLNPKEWTYHYNLANEYYQKEMWDESIKEYKQVLKLGHKSAAIHSNLGAAYAQRGSLNQALVQFKQALRLDPKSKDIRSNFLVAQKMKTSQKKEVTLAVAAKAQTLKIIDEPLLEAPIVKGQMNKADNVIENWFSQLKGNILGELDFIDKTTFGYLDSIPKCCGIRIIASNIKEPEACKVRAEKCAQDRPYFEIMNITKLHKRWIGSNESFFVEIGTDLKSDALGHSTHTIRRLEPKDYQKEARQFKDLWEETEEELRQKYGDGSMTKTLFFSTSHRD